MRQEIPDVSVARHWRPIVSYDDLWLGIYPRIYGLMTLNAAAASAWEALRVTGEFGAAIERYKKLQPDRRAFAFDDINACVNQCQTQGFFAEHEGSKTELTGALDDQGRRWQLDITLSCNFRPLRLQVENAQLASVVRNMIVTMRATSKTSDAATLQLISRGDDYFELWYEGKLKRCLTSALAARGAFIAQIVRHDAPASGWAAILHGSVLTRKNRTVLLTAPSGTGKTTLAIHLLKNGWKWLADDMAPVTVMNGKAFVHPNQLAPSIKSGSLERIAALFPSVWGADNHRIGKRMVRYLNLPFEYRFHSKKPLTDIFFLDRSKISMSFRAVETAEKLAWIAQRENWVALGEAKESCIFKALRAADWRHFSYPDAEPASRFVSEKAF